MTSESHTLLLLWGLSPPNSHTLGLLSFFQPAWHRYPVVLPHFTLGPILLPASFLVHAGATWLLPIHRSSQRTRHSSRSHSWQGLTCLLLVVGTRVRYFQILVLLCRV